jgi:phosphatidate cytidylyltransferase
MALNKQTFITRSLSATIFVAVLLGAVYFNYWIATVFFAIISCICFYEFDQLAKKLGAATFAPIGYIFGLLSLLVTPLELFQNISLATDISNFIYLLPVIIGVSALFSKTDKPIQTACFTLFGLAYCFLPFVVLLRIPLLHEPSVEVNYQALTILGLIFLIWANDTFAYIGGSLIGKNKMIERVSPGKTWEGTIIGVLCCIGVGFILNLAGLYENMMIWPCIALLVAVFGTIGDLIESLLKRQAGVKDSGRLMPGHGGALDRFDSLIIAAPVVFVFLKCNG